MFKVGVLAILFLFLFSFSSVFAQDRFIIGTGDANNTIIDTTTGLMWERSPNMTSVRWLSAISYCDNLMGENGRGEYDDWRLPTIQELLSLVDYRFSSPCFSNSKGTDKGSYGDPFMIPSYWYAWSKTSSSSFYAWGVNWDYGATSSYSKTDGTRPIAWCVRGNMSSSENIIIQNDCPVCKENVCSNTECPNSQNCSNEKETVYLNNCTNKNLSVAQNVENEGISQTIESKSLANQKDNTVEILLGSFLVVLILVLVAGLFYYLGTRRNNSN